MFLDKSDWLVFQDPWLVSWIRIGVLALSFISLGIFGLRALQPQRRLTSRERLWLIGGLCLYVTIVILVGGVAWASHADRLRHIDAMLRYFVAVPAALLASVALFHQAGLAKSQDRGHLANVIKVGCLGIYPVYNYPGGCATG